MNTKHLAELAKAATPGPWTTVGMSYYHYQIHGKGVDGYESERICSTTNAVANDAPAERRKANAAYIAAASPDVILELIAENEALMADVKAFVNAVRLDRHDWEDWPTTSHEAYLKIRARCVP